MCESDICSRIKGSKEIQFDDSLIDNSLALQSLCSCIIALSLTLILSLYVSVCLSPSVSA